MLGYYKLHEALREIKEAGLSWQSFSRKNTGMKDMHTIYYSTTQVHNYIQINTIGQ